MAEKHWPQEEKSAYNGYESQPRSLKGRESDERNPETGDSEKKYEENSDALDTGGAHAVTIGDIPSVEWFQVRPNGISRLIMVNSRKRMRLGSRTQVGNTIKPLPMTAVKASNGYRS